MKMKLIPFVFLIILLSYIFSSMALTYWHESVHKSIFKEYGIDSKIHYSLTRAYTMPEKNCAEDSCRVLHGWNEIVGYNLQAIFDVFYITLSCFICAWIVINKERIEE